VNGQKNVTRNSPTFKSKEELFQLSNSSKRNWAIMFFSQDVARDRFLEGQLLSGMWSSLCEDIEAFGYMLTVRSSESQTQRMVNPPED
jgi:hypothetical protein